MRFFKPLLAGATLIALAAPALASAAPYSGDRGHESYRDGGYGYRDQGGRDFSVRDDWRRDFHDSDGYRWRHHHHWRRDHRWGYGW
jgi:hypothetical protein